MSEQIARLPGGVTVSIEGPVQQQRFWLKGRYYEEPLLRYIHARYQGGTFIDGGACIGNHALYFARFCADQVIAVEPVRRNYDHMMRNVKLSHLEGRVTGVQAALGEARGRGAMVHAGRYHGQYNLVNGDEVEVTTLDAVVRLAILPVRVIKLDVQWSEPAALRGARELLSSQRPALFVEAVHARDVRAVEDALRGTGYRRGARFGGRSAVYEYTRLP